MNGASNGGGGRWVEGGPPLPSSTDRGSTAEQPGSLRSVLCGHRYIISMIMAL